MIMEREVGLTAVRKAARVCEAVRTQMVVGAEPHKLDKQDRSPVTVADFGAQAIICHLIDQAFPHDSILAEEDSTALRETANAHHRLAIARFVGMELGEVSEDRLCQWIDRGQGTPGDRFWVLDPIDGTKGFLRHDQYAIALALIEHGEVQLGFLVCPALPHEGGIGLIFVAQKDHGTDVLTLDGIVLGKTRVRMIQHLNQIRLAESVESAHTNRGLSGQLRDMLGIATDPVRMDSQAKYAAVALGNADIYLRSPNQRTPDYRENIWDHAAGWLIVTEAGGRVTDVYGAPLDWTHGRRLEQNIGVVVTNGQVHDTVIDTLAPLLPVRASTLAHHFSATRGTPAA